MISLIVCSILGICCLYLGLSMSLNIASIINGVPVLMPNVNECFTYDNYLDS